MNRYSKLLLIIITATCVAQTTEAQIFGFNFEKQKNTISTYKYTQQTLYKNKNALLNAAKQMKESLLHPKPEVESRIIKWKTLFNKGLSYINDKIVTLPSKIYTKPVQPLSKDAPKIVTLNKIIDAYTEENKKHTFNIGLTEEISSGMDDIKNHVTGACENTLKNLEKNPSNIHYSTSQRYCVSKSLETQKNLFDRLKNYFLKNKPKVLTACQEKQTTEAFGFNKKSNIKSIMLPQKCRQQMYDYANKKESDILIMNPKNIETLQENLAFTDKTSKLAKKLNDHVDGSCKHILTSDKTKLQDPATQSCVSKFIDAQKNLFSHVKSYFVKNTPQEVPACNQKNNSDSPQCLGQIYDSVKKVWTNTPLKNPKELETMTENLALAEKMDTFTQAYNKNVTNSCKRILTKNEINLQDPTTQSCVSKFIDAQKNLFGGIKSYFARKTPKEIPDCNQENNSNSPTCINQIYKSVKNVWTKVPLEDPKNVDIMDKKLALAKIIGLATQTYENTIAPKNTSSAAITTAQKKFFERLKGYLLKHTDKNTLSECQTTPDRSFLNTVKNYFSNNDPDQKCYEQIHNYIEKENIGSLIIDPKKLDLGNASSDFREYCNYAIAGILLAATGYCAYKLTSKMISLCFPRKKAPQGVEQKIEEKKIKENEEENEEIIKNNESFLHQLEKPKFVQPEGENNNKNKNNKNKKKKK